MKKEFWKKWKRKTEIEKKAINSLKQGKKIIFKNIPKKEIIAIYIKGSFAMRELNKRSDVDIVTILKTNRYRKKLEKLDKEYKNKYKPPIELSSFSLWELKQNKHFYKPKSPRARPDRFVKKIRYCKLIYGKPLKTQGFITRTNKENFKSLINAFNKNFFPLYEKGKLGFSQVLKEVFWLVELEQKIKGKNPPPYSFRELNKFVKDKNHIIHEAWTFRTKRIKDRKKRRLFIIKLKKYLKMLKNI